MSNTRGNFNRFSGQINIDPADDPENSLTNAAIEAVHIDAGATHGGMQKKLPIPQLCFAS